MADRKQRIRGKGAWNFVLFTSKGMRGTVGMFVLNCMRGTVGMFVLNCMCATLGFYGMFALNGMLSACSY